jgi:hypothetical protein
LVYGNGQPVCDNGDLGTLRNTRVFLEGGHGGGLGGGGGQILEFKGSYSDLTAGGAAGGGRGEHGRRVFILAEDGISGSGSVNMSGNAGYNATQIYSITASGGRATYWSGGGGGGGAGGSGGAIWVKYNGSIDGSISFLANGGSGGLRSRNKNEHPDGFSNGVNGAIDGTSPQDGSSGSSGLIDVQLI